MSTKIINPHLEIRTDAPGSGYTMATMNEYPGADCIVCHGGLYFSDLLSWLDKARAAGKAIILDGIDMLTDTAYEDIVDMTARVNAPEGFKVIGLCTIL